MLERVNLVDFRNHRETSVELHPFTVLVGPNGAGKTSILHGLHLFSRLPHQRADLVFRGELGPEFVVRRGAESMSIGVAGRTEGTRWKAKVSLTQDPAAPPQADWPWRASIESDVGGDMTVRDSLKTLPATGTFGTPREVTDQVRSAVLLQLDGDKLASPAPPSIRPQVEYDGSGLPAVLASLRLEHEERFAAIAEDLRKVVPAFRRLAVVQIAVQEDVKYALSFDFEGARGIPAHAVSQGTLIALGLITKLRSPGAPRLFLLDDLDHALHPRAQAELVGIIRAITVRGDGAQVVATTHSPYLVDCMEAGEVQVVALAEDGTARVRSLASHPDAETALQVLTAGEFLSAEGEAWAAGADRA